MNDYGPETYGDRIAEVYDAHGFEPIEHTLERRVDERVAWAKP